MFVSVPRSIKEYWHQVVGIGRMTTDDEWLVCAITDDQVTVEDGEAHIVYSRSRPRLIPVRDCASAVDDRDPAIRLHSDDLVLEVGVVDDV
jgi:hypothetical protein